ncbi:prostaglandin F2 receptor negative regulator-like [Engraulis encrasicolus]|uniref:prostaglandin F2 receptor negative regulator-like n=1 Tax=Engraulis encrasicolus TaxID=184585 RepID=UPI002FCEC726
MENVLFAALTFLTTLALCEGRVVKVPDGPLVRVEGQDVAILCTVSNYEGPRDQDFEWIMVQAGTKYQIVSTFDSRFPDDLFKDRVASGAISIKKLSDSSAELRIKKVRATDSATYQCSTPSTDTTTSGNYEADVELRVIGDSLTVVPSIPKLAVSEGEQLELYCNATRSFSEHTSLSVTWSLKKNDVLTFGPDDKVTVGDNYAQRYVDGGLRLDLRGGGLYGLAVLGARPEDQGKYVCTAREWVRQADGSLTKILEKSEDMGKVTVTPTAQSMAVTVAKNTTLNMEDTLNLTCSVAAGNTAPLALEVEWLKSDGSDAPQVLIRMDRDGTVTGGSTQLGMFRVTTREFQLILQKVERSNSGQYSCRVRAWLPQGSSSKWYQAAEVTSQPVQVLVTQLEPEFTVSLSAATAPQFTYDPTELHCAVSDILNLRDDARLGVTWTYQDDTPGDVSSGLETIATLNEQGTLVPGSAYEKRLKSGDIALSRGESNVFKMRLVRTRTQDMGAYSCSVVAWSPSRQGGWEKAKETPSAQVPIRWSPKTPVVSVVAHRVREASSAGSTFEMSCQVTGQNLQNPGYSVLVRTEEKAGAASRKVLSLSPDSVLQLEEWTEPGRVDSVALEKTGPLEYRFRLYGAQLSDRGFYYCDVTAFTREQGGGATGSDAGAGTGSAGGTDWSRVVSGESNKIQIAFEDTGPVFNVSIHSEKHSVAPGETAKLQCIIEVQGASPNRGDVSFEVQWFHSGFHGAQNGGAEPLISMDRWGLVRKNPAASSSANQTAGSTPAPDCSLERSDAHTYTLSVHGARSSDAGEYHCIATPWLLAPASGSWTQGTQLTSPPAYVSIRLALWESVRLPLLYGVAAACGVGLISILLGLMCAQCCCRNNLHTPRSGNKLMDMEMD